MEPKLNRKLHALANGIAPGQAHDFLKREAEEQFKVGYGELTEAQARQLALRLRAVKERVRTEIFRALNGAEGSPISEEHLSQIRQYRKLLGWSDGYFTEMVRARYGEQSLETLPRWKGVRLVLYLQKRWHQKKLKVKNEKIKTGDAA